MAGSGFWDALNQAPSSPSALPVSGAGANTFWDPPGTSTTQSVPGSDPNSQTTAEPVPDSPGNPLSYAFGMVKNVVMDIPDVLKGLWAVGKATVGDALGAVGQATPGTFWGEEQVQKHGYAWGNIARATVGWGDRPSVLLDDYKSRYGFNGLEEVKDQLYSNPLSYILDALAVAGGVSVAAKTGAKLGMVSDSAVTAIRGLTPEAEALGRLSGVGKPVQEVVSLTSQMAKTPVETFASTVRPVTRGGAVVEGLEGISTSTNWMKRAIQSTVINKLLTRSTDDAAKLIEGEHWNRLGISADNLGLQEVARTRLAMGAQQGLRVMRPTPDKFVTSRAARYISGITKQEFYGQRNAMISSLRQILDPEDQGLYKGKNWQLVKDIMGTNEFFERQLRGEVIAPGGLPSSNPIDLEAGNAIHYFGDMDTPQVGVDPNVRTELLMKIDSFFSSKANKDVTPGQTIEVVGKNFTSPHSLDLGQTAMRFTGLVGDMVDAPTAIRRYADSVGDEILGVRNYLADGTSPWNGMSYFLRRQDGNVYEVNIADQAIYDTQRIVSQLNDHINEVSGLDASYTAESARQARILEELGVTLDTAGPEDAQKLLDLENVRKLERTVKEEIEATMAIRQRMWDYPMRRLNSTPDDNGIRRYGDEFGENAEKVDRLYNWSVEHHQIPGMVKQWRKGWAQGILQADGSLTPIRGPFTVAINRAFMPQKLEALHHITEFGVEDIEKVIRKNVMGDAANNIPPVHDTESIVLNIAELLEQDYHMPRHAIRDALLTPTDADVARAMRTSAEEGVAMMSPQARTRILELADDLRMGPAKQFGEPEVNYRARGFTKKNAEGKTVPLDPVKEPAEAARLIINRLMTEVKANILKGEVDGLALEDWSWKNFAEVAPQLPGYYPHIRAGQKANLWFKGQNLKPPQMAFNKGFKGYLMESGRVQADVFQANAFRAYQILRHHEMMDQVDMLVPMARELGEKELLSIQSGAGSMDGEVLFSPELFKNQLSLHSTLLDDIHSGVVEKGMLYEDAAMDAIQQMNTHLQDVTTGALAEGKVYALPKHVADQFKSGFVQGFSPAPIRFFWDKPRDLWISSVLGMNPRWFIYRAMGNVVFAGIHGGVDDVARLFGWAKPKNDRLIQMLLEDTKMPDGTSVLEHMSRGYTAGELQKLGFGTATAKPGKLGTPAQSRLREWGSVEDYAPRATKMADALYKHRVSAIPKSIVSRMTRRVNLMEQAERRGIALGEYGKAIGSRWEGNLALARKISSEGIDEQLAGQLQTQANWVLGNYTMLSPLERDVVRRFLMPFYPFYRHMVKFSTRMPWDHPVKSQVLRLLHEVDEDMGPHLPGYMGGAVPIGSIGGLPTYWNTTHWNPLSELALPEGSPVMFLDPRLRTLYMAASGTDEFNQPYHADNVYTAPNGVEMIKTATGWQEFEGIQHEPWVDMMMSWYSGPGSQSLNLRGYNSPWWKEVAGQAGLSLSQRNPVDDMLRNLEAEQAAFSSDSAAEVPQSWGQ